MNLFQKQIKNGPLAVLAALVMSAAQAQNPTAPAVGGGRGIFVYSPKPQAAGTWAGAAATSIQVERRVASGTAFAPVAQLSAPATAAEFEARVLSFNRRLTIPLTGLEGPLVQKLARIWERTHRLDSLRAYSQLMPVQQAVGLVLLDSTAQRGTSYVYRVTAQRNGAPVGAAAQSAAVSWPGKPTGGKLKKLPAVTEDNRIIPRWRQLDGPQRAVYVQLRRQDDARGEWKTAAAPLTLESFQKALALVAYDRNVQPVHAYRYTLRTLDQYENPGPAADTVLAAAYNFLDAAVLRDFRAQAQQAGPTTEPGIRLSWRLPDANKLRSVRIFRSTLLDKDFKLLAEVTPTEAGYFDATAAPMQKYYYYVQPTGLLQEPGVPSSKAFALFEDQRPPLPPHEVRAAPVPGGIRLRWLPGDKFTKGYYVYRAAGPAAKLTLVGALRPHQEKAAEQVFVDSSRTLQPAVRYRYAVQAENSSHRPSIYSDTVETTAGVKRPVATAAHALAPVAGAEAQWENGRPVVRWQAAPEAAFYEVSRRVEGQPQFQRLPLGPRMPGSRTERRPLAQAGFCDSTARPGQSYEYEIVSLDEQGRRSTPARLSLRAAETAAAPATLTAAAVGKTVELRWAAEAAAPQYRVYRYEPGAKPQAVATVAASPATYRDATVQPRRTYFYYVASLDAQRREAARSEPIGVRVP
ncbi:fibronectin type III domain-containing protein [Hymenobacter chitinivorans]|uniref:Fibronectin type 3 domain-containing protein n=1 Tax=Hymenobacter chitinivorans DSM 11115 TaxID=1121954 RepID=A0A2M9BL50_9BACT|nr:hypothetical protein [Hymenobacter chitinivorans]PJJ58678.1 fibronectin type 3 domain-containing protein [Hymenobacter chitinivorans DSM 11115]